MIQLRPYQAKADAEVVEAWRTGKKRVLLQLPTGGGKCLVKGTPVLMFDGSIRPVEQVQEGDLLMGDDSTPRRVLSTCIGKELCYNVVPVKGETWGCNLSHVLSLKCIADAKPFQKGQVYDIELRHYLALPAWQKHVLKQYRVGVEFDQKPVPVDPYFIGIWLGDGTTRCMDISNPDIEVRNALEAMTHPQKPVFYNQEKREGKCISWKFPAKENRLLLDAFKSLSLIENKHIPALYKCNSRQVRLELLAGLIDTDGHFGNNFYEIIAKSTTLADDILFIARSLGLAAYKSVKSVTLKEWNEPRNYWRIKISGDVDMIPAKVERKKARPRGQIKNVLHTGFELSPRGTEDYYGFEIDGNRRFLLGDFTVTHNTIMFNHRAAIAAQKGFRVLIVADRRELIQQAWSRLWQASGLHGGIIMSGHAPAYMLPVQIASVQTLNRRSFPPDMDIVIIDEARGSVADSYKPIFEFYKDSYFLGVDATPIRANGQGFDHLYDHMVCGPTIKDLEAMGSLVPGKPYINPLDPRLLDKIKLTAGDYNEKELSEMMSNQQMTADLVASKLKFAKGLKTIVFAVSIKHSKLIIEQYRQAGISAAHVDGEMPMAERDAIFKAFKNGKYEVLCNVGIACYGFDEPTIQCVQLARPTKSLALYLQQIGRGTRPLPGKENYILLDHANCIIEHGLPNTERKWSLKGKKKEKSKPRQFKIKIGDEEKIVSARDFPQQMEGMELQEVDEVTLRMAEFETMALHAEFKGHKKLSAVYRYLEKYPDCGALELQYIEKKLGFKSGWWKYKFKELEENRTKQVQK